MDGLKKSSHVLAENTTNKNGEKGTCDIDAGPSEKVEQRPAWRTFI